MPSNPPPKISGVRKVIRGESSTPEDVTIWIFPDFSETNILSSSNAIDQGLSKFVATISTDSVETFWIIGSGSGGEFEGNVSVKTTAENNKAPSKPTIWNFLYLGRIIKNWLESFYSFPNLKRVYTS